MAEQMEFWTRYPSLIKGLEANEASRLEQYCLLGRIGDFPAAEDVWSKQLEQHSSTFLYLISYIDNVLRQTRYGDAIDCLVEYQTHAVDVERADMFQAQSKVLSVMTAYLNLFTRGWLRAAVLTARDTVEWLAATEMKDYDDYHIHAIELCMHILKYAQIMSTYTTPQDLLFPSKDCPVSEIPWSGYFEWAICLVRRGRHWEAINVIKILASTKKTSWSIESYEGIEKVLRTLDSSIYINVSRVALLVALGRRFAIVPALDKAIRCVDKARQLLNDVEAQLGRKCLRQRIELEMAELELQASTMDAYTSLQKWHGISLLAKERLEWGIESTCLTNIAQTAAANGMIKELFEYAKRLQVVEEEMERDTLSVLSNRCGLWRAHDRQHLAELLRWFDNHEEKHPIAGILTGDPIDDDMQKWDIPWPSACMAQLRYIMYSALGDMERARSYQSIANEIMNYVPWFRVVEMKIVDRYTLEWFDPLSAKPITPFEILSRRIKTRYSDLATSDSTDWYRYRELDHVELRNVVLSFPFDQPRFEARLASLQDWFNNDEMMDQRSSHYLIALLYLEHYDQAKSTDQDFTIKSIIVKQLEEFAKNLPGSSDAVKRSILSNILLAWQELYDVTLKDLTLSSAKLQDLRKSYLSLITRYEGSHLASNLPTIGSLHGRLAEIDFRLAVSEIGFYQAMQSLDKAMVYYDNFRISISALKDLPALEIKASIRQGLVGDREVLHRAISALIVKWLNPDIPGDIKACISNHVWNLIQKTKNRALNDALSQENVLSADDRAAIGANLHSTELLKDWQKALEGLCLATQAENPNVSNIAQAQENIRVQEQNMLADPLCTKVIALTKGATPSITDLSKLFMGSKERIILVDWFTADIPIARDKLMMVTVQICPEPETPKIHNLQLGIAYEIHKWNLKYLTGQSAAANRRTQQAFNDLKDLSGLVKPLATISQRNDILVFCPTTKLNLHRIPLHAIEMASSQTVADQHPNATDNVLMLRNLIIYTYSQSLLRLSVASRQYEPLHYERHATILSPLASNSSSFNDADSRDIAGKISNFSKFLAVTNNTTTLKTSTEVTKSAAIRAMLETSFLTFLGHVHLAPRPIKSHLLLYDPSPKPHCGPHEAEVFLSGEDIITRARLKQGAHVLLLACGSGVTEARVLDEVLGLVPAFFHAGARSVVATLWEVKIVDACAWLQAVQHAWESTERKMRRKESAVSSSGGTVDDMINLAALCRSAARTLFYEKGKAGGIDSWAPFVYSGYWMYPRAKIKVGDSEEEDD